MDTKETNISLDLVKAVQAYREAVLHLGEVSRSLGLVRTEHSKAIERVAFLQGQIDGFTSALRERAPEGTPWCGPKGPQTYEEMRDQVLGRGIRMVGWLCACGNRNPPGCVECLCGRNKPC